MLRKFLFLAALIVPVSAHAQSLGDIRGSIAPDDSRSARYLNAYPTVEGQQFVEYQPRLRNERLPPTQAAVEVYSPYLGLQTPKGTVQDNAYEAYSHSAPPAERAAAQEYNILQKGFLATRPGIEGGLHLAGYHYQEPYVPPAPGTRVEIDGLRYGAQLASTFTFEDPLRLDKIGRWFVTAETRFSYAEVDYKGSGKASNKPDYLWESRLLIGHDFLRGVTGFSPYTGLGYRYLFNDNRGVSSTGSSGYRRQSQYVYMPIGTTLRFDIFGDGSRVSINGEYDWLLQGKQKSYVQDISAGDPITNTQKNGGHGWRASAMYELGNWAAGPYVNYWNIDRSTTDCNSALTCGFEPRNQTVEYGVRVNYRFWNF